MTFDRIELNVPEKLTSPYPLVHQVQAGEIRLPALIRMMPGRKILARIALEALRPAIKDLLRYAVELGRELLDRVERDADRVIDDLGEQ